MNSYARICGRAYALVSIVVTTLVDVVHSCCTVVKVPVQMQRAEHLLRLLWKRSWSASLLLQ